MGQTDSHIAIATEDCRVSVMDTQRSHLVTKATFDKNEEGYPVDIYAANNLLYVLTHHSYVFCFDCR